jgi:hypothetical protein
MLGYAVFRDAMGDHCRIEKAAWQIILKRLSRVGKHGGSVAEDSLVMGYCATGGGVIWRIRCGF